MFEVGFTEIILIFGIALLVLGPARLPKLAADLGRWAGRARSMARQLRSQLEQEVQFDPLATTSTPPRPATGSGAVSPSTPSVTPETTSATSFPGEPSSAGTPAGARETPEMPPAAMSEASPTTQTDPDERKPW